MKPRHVLVFGLLGCALVASGLAIYIKRDYLFSVSDSSGSPQLDWRKLGELDYVGGKVSADLQSLDGTIVKIPGFMVALEDSSQNVKEFLLVPSPQACIHVPAPPSNQMVYVHFENGKGSPPQSGPIWVEGTLKISPKKHAYGEASFELIAKEITPYK